MSCGLDVEPQVAFREGQKQKEKNMKIRKLQIAIMAASLAVAMSAKASVVVYATPPIGGGTYYAGPPSGTIGSEFTVSSGLTVYQAGVFDYGSDGLAASHDVGVWNLATGQLLDTATVAAGTVDPLINGFRWTTLATPLILTPGITYVVGAYYGYGAGDNDYFMTQATINSPFTYIQDADSNPNNVPGQFSMQMPTANDNLAGFWGPNLSNVPEPTTMIAGALLLLPFGASTLRILRRRTA
jgi:hypothetical protein